MKRIVITMAFASLVQAQTIQYTEYVGVQSSQAQYQNVSRQIPYQECYDERVTLTRPNHGSNQIAGSILGGAIGGVLGHQIGRGEGKDIATVGGAILGSIVGGGRFDGQARGVHSGCETQRRCITKYRQSHSHRELTGYRNIAYYKGKQIVKYSNERLHSIPITVTIDY